MAVQTGISTELAAEAVASMPSNTRNATNTTLSFSKKSFEAAMKRIKAMRYELLELASADREADQVYQLNVNLFPLSGPMTGLQDKNLSA